MRFSARRWVVAFATLLAFALPLTASASVSDAVSSFTYTQNMHPMGFSERAVPLTGAGSGIFNSDLAFWGKRAFQGTYEGFRIIDITQPDNPVEIENFTGCVGGTTTGNQGDLVVWGNILVRSWNSPAPTEGAICGGVTTPGGQEGLHVFDISDPTNPVGLTFVATPCGSHTASGVPDLANNRLLIYNSPSSSASVCRGIDIVQVPLGNPSTASYLRFEPSGDPTFAGGFENVVTVDSPSSAAGAYGATGAVFGPAPTPAGVSGSIVLVNDGATPPGGTTSDGCEPFTLSAGAIALLDRGLCGFVVKVKNAQDAGAAAVIVANNAAGDPITMGGTDPSITIPSVMVSQANGVIIKAGLPATGKIASNPTATRSCHDTGVILGSELKAACAGGNGLTVWSMSPADGGSLVDPAILYQRTFEGVSIGHSAAFTWDGEVLVFGHEPGGGGQAQCQATSAAVNRTLFFLDADTGDTVGTFLHPRPQTATENCTWHNYNVVPTDKRYVLVSGSYQAGVSVVDFTNPASAAEVAYADPAPLSDTTLIGGGDWSTYWYNGLIYESDMKRGLIVWNLSSNVVAGAKKLDHLNPQTQETTLP